MRTVADCQPLLHNQPVSSSIRDDAIGEVAEPLKTTKHSRASFHADVDVVEQLEFALVGIEEEELEQEMADEKRDEFDDRLCFINRKIRIYIGSLI